MKKQHKLFKKRDVDYQISDVMPTLPRRYYQSKKIYRKELEKIFYRRWLLACREEEIPEVGDFLLVPVRNRKIFFMRWTKRF